MKMIEPDVGMGIFWEEYYGYLFEIFVIVQRIIFGKLKFRFLSMWFSDNTAKKCPPSV